MTANPARNDGPADLDAGSWSVSILFWLVLFVCGGLYAGVALAPKLSAYLDLRQRYVENQLRLVELETRNDHLERVAHALETDPRFAGELLRANLDAGRPGEERIPVDATHHLRIRADRTAAAAATRPAAPWYEPFVDELARRDDLRRSLLVGIAIVIVLAFAVLHDANGPIVWRLMGGLVAATGWLGRRYGRRRPADQG